MGASRGLVLRAQVEALHPCLLTIVDIASLEARLRRDMVSASLSTYFIFTTRHVQRCLADIAKA